MSSLLARLGRAVPAPAVWSYIGAFANDPLAGAVMRQGALHENTQLPHSNERLDRRLKHSDLPGMVENNKKGYSAVTGPPKLLQRI